MTREESGSPTPSEFASNEHLQRFAYTLSHDLQEPLRMVSSYLELLETELEAELDEQTREYFDYASGGAERMREMIDGLLEYSRVESRGEAFTETDATEVLSEVCRTLELKIEDADAAVRFDEFPTVSADEGQLGQLFQNLLTNAIDHGGSGVRIDVTAEERADAFEFAIADDGPGIPESSRDDLFGLFSKGRDSEGTGMGLAICERTVERHGGEIWIDSEVEGATARFTLPKR